MAPPNVTIVVFGDIGRSPRMQYHASSFLKVGFNVDIIGYGGSKPVEYLTSHKQCQLKYLAQVPQFTKNLPALAAYFFKILWQLMTLSWVLLMNRKAHHVLVQTPPAIPALAICWLYCRVFRAYFYIDWHNYAFSIMALTHGKGHKLVTISEVFEGYFGRKADANLCVTKAMKEDLLRRWSIRAVTLYDRAPEHFGSISPQERQNLMTRYDALSNAGFVDNAGALRTDRPGLLVSSTSWTEDEDFSILLSALQDYDNSEDPALPPLVCVITGKGPLRDHYMQQVHAQQWVKVKVVSLWLETRDYPRILAAADLGVSLHTSSSGLDLPMKVVDMFGSGLPVAVLHFSCLNELVRHGDNGLVFHDSEELSKQLRDWFRGFPHNEMRHQFKDAIAKFQSLRWHENWKIQAFPLFNHQ